MQIYKRENYYLTFKRTRMIKAKNEHEDPSEVRENWIRCKCGKVHKRKPEITHCPRCDMEFRPEDAIDTSHERYNFAINMQTDLFLDEGSVKLSHTMVMIEHYEKHTPAMFNTTYRLSYKFNLDKRTSVGYITPLSCNKPVGKKFFNMTIPIKNLFDFQPEHITFPKETIKAITSAIGVDFPEKEYKGRTPNMNDIALLNRSRHNYPVIKEILGYISSENYGVNDDFEIFSPLHSYYWELGRKLKDEGKASMIPCMDSYPLPNSITKKRVFNKEFNHVVEHFNTYRHLMSEELESCLRSDINSSAYRYENRCAHLKSVKDLKDIISCQDNVDMSKAFDCIAVLTDINPTTIEPALKKLYKKNPHLIRSYPYLSTVFKNHDIHKNILSIAEKGFRAKSSSRNFNWFIKEFHKGDRHSAELYLSRKIKKTIDLEYLEDTLSMLKDSKNNNYEVSMKGNISTIHNRLSYLTKYNYIPDAQLQNSADDEDKVMGDYTIRYAKHTRDLKMLGSSMSICVAGYWKDCLKEDTKIFYVLEDDVPVACCELSIRNNLEKPQLVQAKGRYNAQVDVDVQELIVEHCREKGYEFKAKYDITIEILDNTLLKNNNIEPKYDPADLVRLERIKQFIVDNEKRSYRLAGNDDLPF